MLYFIKLFVYFILMSSSIVHASDTKAGLPQLDLSTYPSLMFWAVISLIIGYFLMSFLVAPNIKSILNLRETNIFLFLLFFMFLNLFFCYLNVGLNPLLISLKDQISQSGLFNACIVVPIYGSAGIAGETTALRGTKT